MQEACIHFTWIRLEACLNIAQNILLRAKPSIQISKWKSILVETRQFILIGGNVIINFASNIIEYGIDDSLSYLLSLENSIFDFKYIRAAESLTDVKIKISNFLRWDSLAAM